MNPASSATSPTGFPLPWYRHRAPWLLMAGPLVVVVASFITIWLAIRTDDGLVTNDYYRKGLAINQTLKLSERARSLGLQAALGLEVDRIHLRLAARDRTFTPPARIQVTVSHPTRAGMDQTQVLNLREGHYVGHFRLPPDGHWIVLLEDEEKTWRILGNMILPADGEVLLGEVEHVASSVTSAHAPEAARTH